MGMLYRMHGPHWFCGVPAAILLGFAGLRNVSAGLPSLNEQPWLGYFKVYENSRCQFTISPHGKATLAPTNAKRKPVGATKEIRIYFGIEEVLPDGNTRLKKLQPDTLESADPASEGFEKTVIRGKVTGGAAFEAAFEQERGTISIGGRVTDPGTLTANPIRFVVRVNLPNIYASVEKEGKEDLKSFRKRIRGDRIELKRTDGSRYKETLDQPVDANSKEINGPGIADAEIKLSAYDGKKLRFSASTHSSITLHNDQAAPLHEGFSLHWLPDAAKDPQGRSRLSIEVR